MPKYLVEASYTADAIKPPRSEGGSARVATNEALIEGLGGTLECFYFAFGDTDAYIVADLPDNANGCRGADGGQRERNHQLGAMVVLLTPSGDRRGGKARRALPPARRLRAADRGPGRPSSWPGCVPPAGTTAEAIADRFEDTTGLAE